MNKLIVILGPTASGKTDSSVKLAKKYNGEVVSADSRQVYRGLDIGSGKITKKEMHGIPHYLLDVANPKTRFSVSQYQKLALSAIKKIQKKGKIPFLVGGTGFYIQSIVDGIIIPEVKPDWNLRKKLEKKSNGELFSMLEKLDPERAKLIDRQNPRRLIRALEIVLTTGKPVTPLKQTRRHCEEQSDEAILPLDCHASRSDARNDKCSILKIGIEKSPTELKKLINKRLLKRLKNNALINEVKKLHKSGVSFKRLEELGLEYRFVAQYLQNKISHQEMRDKIQMESEHFVKRQMTWFKRDKKIIWISNITEALSIAENFIAKQ